MRIQLYILSQVIGALVAPIFCALVHSGDFKTLGCNQMTQFLTEDGESDGWHYVSALIMEIVITWAFLMTIFAAVNPKNNLGGATPIVIGMALMILAFTGSGISSGSLNPARSLGPAAIQAMADTDNLEPIKQIWIYIVGPMAGGAIAALITKVMG